MDSKISRISIKLKKKKQIYEQITTFLEERAINYLESKFQEKFQIEKVYISKNKIFFIDGKPLLAGVKNVLFPTLIFKKFIAYLPKIIVDMGAVPYICNGAHLMAPGVLKITGSFQEKKIVTIIDERHNLPIAIALSLFNSELLVRQKKGVIANNLHYIGDEIWNYLKHNDTY